MPTPSLFQPAESKLETLTSLDHLDFFFHHVTNHHPDNAFHHMAVRLGNGNWAVVHGEQKQRTISVFDGSCYKLIYTMDVSHFHFIKLYAAADGHLVVSYQHAASHHWMLQWHSHDLLHSFDMMLHIPKQDGLFKLQFQPHHRVMVYLPALQRIHQYHLQRGAMIQNSRTRPLNFENEAGLPNIALIKNHHPSLNKPGKKAIATNLETHIVYEVDTPYAISQTRNMLFNHTLYFATLERPNPHVSSLLRIYELRDARLVEINRFELGPGVLLQKFLPTGILLFQNVKNELLACDPFNVGGRPEKLIGLAELGAFSISHVMISYDKLLVRYSDNQSAKQCALFELKRVAEWYQHGLEKTKEEDAELDKSSFSVSLSSSI